MSSLYNRWVPPKKPKAPVQPSKSPEPQPSPVAAVPPSTLYASTPYARYVPPKKTTPQAIPRQPSNPPVITTKSHDEEPEDPKPKKRRKVEKDGKEPSKDKKDKKKRKREDTKTDVTERPPANQSDDVETGIATMDLDEPVSAPVDVEMRAGTEVVVADEEEEMKEAELEYDAAEAILAKYRTAMKKSVQVETAIKAKRAKEGIRTPTPEPELHGLEPLPQPAQDPREAYNPTFESLPSWIGAPRVVTSKDTVKFEELGLSKKVRDNLSRKEYTEALPVQSAVLPLMLAGPGKYFGDICVSAPTGSGKTMAYVLPLVEGLQKRLVKHLSGLIIVPTRELVTQAREVAKSCAVGTGVKFGTAVGNVALATEQAALIHKGQKYDPKAAEQMHDKAAERIRLGYDEDDTLLEDVVTLLPGHVPEYTSEVDVLICTPGRLVDHIRSTPGFTLEHVEWLIIDEVDQLLDQNFQDFVNVLHPALFHTKTYSQMTALEKVLMSVKGRFEHRFVQKVILSATMTRNLTQLASLKLHRPTLIALQSEIPDDLVDHTPSTGGFELPASLEETAIPVADGSDKPLYLVQLLRDELSIFPVSSGEADSDSSSDSDSDSSSDDSSHSSIVDSDSDSDSESGSVTKLNMNASGEAVSNIDNIPATKTTSDLARRKPAIYESVLIFTSSNDNASRLRHLLLTFFPQNASLIGTLTKSSATSTGQKVLNAFRTGKIKLLIASDRASRGLDVPDLATVINYDMPSSVTSYVHRVGRTARAGKGGKAWTLYTDSEARWFWKSVAQGTEIQRNGRVVRRMRIDTKKLEDKREKYQKALAELQSAVQSSH
ncbi:hypothetical protein EG327_007189 [Venturia inaequalis]|uniref:ATP-dependent RNA helicase n=1 Tax=Venturia inaequalis TaxID=5025 RepID=A0A8H3Z0T2_VENIN|nr:hypothetical protein EG327_007189 [Venturia inaequalis]